jgi:hypothetical protein
VKLNGKIPRSRSTIVQEHVRLQEMQIQDQNDEPASTSRQDVLPQMQRQSAQTGQEEVSGSFFLETFIKTPS